MNALYGLRCGLTPVYSFRVTAVNAVGAGPPGQPSFPVQTLREAPSGQVADLRAVSRGATAVQLTWRPAPPSTLHGEFLGYQLTYRSPATGTNRSLVITEQNVTALVVSGLEAYTEYLFSLAIRNPRGLGPAAMATGRTRQSVPGAPASVRYTDVGSSWVLLMWTPPAQRNGMLLRYCINISGVGLPAELRWLPASEDRWLQHKVDRLNPFTFYNVGVLAETSVGRGPARHVRLRTDTSSPGLPLVLDISCVKDGATQVRWLGPPPDSQPAVSFFTIGYRNERDRKYQLTRTPAGLGEHTIIMHNLDEGMTYFKIQAVRRSRYSRSTVYRGVFTEPWSALLPRPRAGCERFRLIHPRPEDSTLAVGVGVLPDWRQEAIPAHMFAGYVRDLRRGADAGFWKEMAAIDGAAAPPANGHHVGANGTNGTNGCTKPVGFVARRCDACCGRWGEYDGLMLNVLKDGR
ncbi:protein sidekick-2-like [Pollicipes pollicipes]|uniref:protein sidekick-2-like n=1 Tax=Pollicipes pollicipes TaxID=41117 RepID=UPI00188525AE|nr:protein sidekick-2-like [Pollicipes pollicipes]